MAKLTSKKVQWFPIPGDEDGAELLILHLKPGEIQRIEAETSRWVASNKDEKFISEMEYRPQDQLRKLRLAAVIGWKGFLDEQGLPLECNVANKEMYLNEDPVLGSEAKRLSEWIDTFRIELAGGLKVQEEKAEGN